MKLPPLSVISTGLLISACVQGTLIPQDQIQEPFSVDLEVGTTWIYQDFGSLAEEKHQVEVTVERDTWFWFDTVGFDRSQTISQSKQRFKAEVLSRPAQLRATIEEFESSYGYWINTIAGLVKVYSKTSPFGYMKIPSRGSPVSSFWYIDSGWKVTNWDTLITVPAGDFRCIMIQFSGLLESKTAEYWAPRVGLVRRTGRSIFQPTVRRERIVTDWQLISYMPGIA